MSVKLPPLQPGKEYGYLIYPGGRTELRQYTPDMFTDASEAIELLYKGLAVRVRMSEVTSDLERFIESKGKAT